MPKLVCSPWMLPAAVLLSASLMQAQPYRLTFSSLLGGNAEEQGRGITADSQGNIYVVGGTASPDFPIRNGTPVSTEKPTDPTCRENMDAFVVKVSPEGRVIWSTAIGGPNYERAYDVWLDRSGNIYIGARGGIGSPVTAGTFQGTFHGGGNLTDLYGKDSAMIAKLDPNGHVLWASFVGMSTNTRSLAVDRNGDVYADLIYDPKSPAPEWYGGPAFAHAYQKTPNPKGDDGIVKISSDGKTVKWATFLFGGTDGTAGVGTVKVDAKGNVYFLGNTNSRNLRTTPRAAQKSYGGGDWDLYLAKVSANGSSLLYATYFGGSGQEYNNTHNMAIDNEGHAFVATQTTSPNLPTTKGAYQAVARNTQGTIQVSKFSGAGELLACTYVGGSSSDNVDGISVDHRGNVYLSGDTGSPDFPVTADAYQKTKGAGRSAVFVKLNPDLTKLLYSTFIGTSGNAIGRDNFVDRRGNYYLFGQTSGAGWPLVNAFQSAFGGGGNDAIIAVFSPVRPNSGSSRLRH